ncbi:MAG: GNAT family N-acetyltransferase [Chitinophagia bacterium]|nr:GNAT family N-acetyltransferase [Chitinophagia bacterium]
MNTNIEIVPVLIAQNYDLIAQFMLELHNNENELSDKTAQWQDIKESYMKHVIAMQQENDGTCLIAQINGMPVGFIFGYAEEQDDSRIDKYEGQELYVSDGYVDKRFRRQGVYHALSNALEQTYLQKGIKRITRFTHVNNHNMRRFLEGEGYVITRLLYEKWL